MAPTATTTSGRQRELIDVLLRDRVALSRRQAEADRVVAAAGAGHLVHEMNVRPGDAGGRPWRIDPVPVLIEGAAFDALAAAVARRVHAFERILDDLYGPRQLLRDGIVPGEALSSSVRYRLAAVGTPPPRRWLTTYAVDVVALTDGTWRVVQDLTDVPAGVGYALLGRSAMLRVADELLGAGNGEIADVSSLDGFPAELRHALVTAGDAPSPRIVLFTGGVADPGYVEHSALARTLGFTLIERPDLVVRQGRLWLRTLGIGRGEPGLDPIDVVYRRVEADRVDPVETGASGSEGVPGLLAAVGRGGVTLANAHGSGVIEDPDLAACWPAAAEALTGSALPLDALDDAARRVGLADAPMFRAGEVTSGAAVVRLHAVAGPDGVSVMPGGNGRVLAPGDDPRHPTAQRAKDVWVLGPHAALPVIVAPLLPQVDLAASVPTRAADTLFWAGRAAERAEAIARTVRVVAGSRRQDPPLVVLDGGRWQRRMVAALRAVAGSADAAAGEAPGSPFTALDAELATATQALATKLRAFANATATVGEFLPANTSRCLNAIVEQLDTLRAGTVALDALDDVLAALAMYMGMWNESTVRGPAWALGDLGIRIERAAVVAQLVAACTGAPVDAPGDGHADRAALEVLLAANECLVAYRRRYRSDVELPAAAELLLRDRHNPRSLRTCLDRIAAHARDVGWDDGVAASDRLASLVAGPADEAVDDVLARVPAIATGADELAGMVIARWFTTPVKPKLVRVGTR